MFSFSIEGDKDPKERISTETSRWKLFAFDDLASEVTCYLLYFSSVQKVSKACPGSRGENRESTS